MMLPKKPFLIKTCASYIGIKHLSHIIITFCTDTKHELEMLDLCLRKTFFLEMQDFKKKKNVFFQQKCHLACKKQTLGQTANLFNENCCTCHSHKFCYISPRFRTHKIHEPCYQYIRPCSITLSFPLRRVIDL